MNKPIKDFLERHSDIVASGDISELYQLAVDERDWRNALPYQLTQVLVHCGIDPLASLDYVPDEYMCGGSDVTSIRLPNTIKRIGTKAFFNCKLSSIEIPEGVESIGDKALAFCYQLQDVSLPSTLKSLGRSIFGRDRSLLKIVYNGTQADWEKIDKPADWISVVPTGNLIIIEFNDGTSTVMI